jgi:hypothetical protein
MVVLIAGAGGLMIGEGPRSDGRIGQPPWQAPIALVCLIAGVLAGVLGFGILKQKAVLSASTAIRASALVPLVLVIAMVVAAILRLGGGPIAEGFALGALAPFPAALAFWLAKRD